MKHLALRLTVLFLAFTVFINGASSVLAQESSVTLIGKLVILSGDPPPDSQLAPRQIIMLQDVNGKSIARLIADASVVSSLRGQQVLVTGKASIQSVGADNLSWIDVTTIKPVEAARSSQSFGEGATVSHPWINILCKFSDVAAVPFSPEQYQELFSSTYPGLDHYWRQISLNQINISGTSVVPQWYTLPHPREAYVPNNGNADLDKLLADCVGVADAAVDYTRYDGINLMFNDWLDCCAWGGWRTLALDGQTKTWSITWLPPWGQTYHNIAHEMGHGFGLLHSSGPSVNPPMGNAVYISEWDVMSLSKGSCKEKSKLFDCLPPGTIAYQQEMMGWIPQTRVAVVEAGQIAEITLENTRQPDSSTGYLMVKIPIDGSAEHFYTVEARLRVLNKENYDQNIPSTAVVIHDVLLGRGGFPGTNTGPALVVVADPEADTPFNTVNGKGGAWIVGESYDDAAHDIHIRITSRNNNTFTVTIINQAVEAPVPLSPENNSATINPLPTFTWNSVPGAVGYEIQIDTRNDFSSGGVIRVQTPITSFTVPGSLAAATYYWRVRAQSGGGTWSGWSAVAGFALLSDSMATPMLTQYTSSTPTLAWGPLTWATGYKIEVSRTAAFDTFSFASTLEGSGVSSIQTDPLSHGLYYWRVCPRRADNTFGTCSAVDRFVIKVP